MNRFYINDIEKLTGIKAHTLRIWEKRYNLYKPKRKESNHRYYDNDDLKHILKIAYLYNLGYKISKIAALSQEEFTTLTSLTKEKPGNKEKLVTELLNAAFDFDEELFEDVLNHAIERLGFENCITEIVFPYYEKVGLLWMNNIAIPAQEHFSSNIIRNKLIVAVDKLRTPVKKSGEVFLLFTPEGEEHEIPLLFIYYLLKKNNRNVIYCGTNVSITNLKEITSTKNVTTLYTHIICNFTKYNIDYYLMELQKNFADKKIYISGPVTKNLNGELYGVKIVESIEAFLRLVS